jgi:SPP1 gp7 family putative phage head morphogenesis protein
LSYVYNFLNIGDRDDDLEPPEYPNNEDLIRGVYEGDIAPDKLPDDLFLFSFLVLVEQLNRMYGLPTDFEVNTIRRRRALAAKRNLGFFSGVKTFQNVLELSLAVFGPGGQILPFGDFANIALKINSRYNLDWLRTEQNASFRQSQAIEAWQQIKDDKTLFPLLQYSTVGDSRVRDEHAAIDNVIRPVDDDFWDQWFPPNGYNCRCIVKQIRSGEITPVKKEFDINDDPIFGTNVGKTGMIFPKTHPYNEVPQQFQKSADNNFGFTIPPDKDIKDFLDGNS